MPTVSLDQALQAVIDGGEVRVEPPPATTAKLMNVVNSGDFSLSDVSEIVSSDQALAAYVLRQASSAGRAGREIDTLADAVSILGAKEVMSMAVAMGVGAQACQQGPLQALRLDVWRRATFSASFCRSVARHFKVKKDQAFLVGLLANLGRSVALSCLEDALPANPPARSSQFWLDLTRRHEGDLGVAMATKWGLPPFVVEVQTALRDAADAPEDPLARLAFLSDRVGELVDSTATVTDEMLAAIPGLEKAADRGAILAVLDTLGVQMWSLNPDAPEPKAASAVEVDEGAPLVAAVRKLQEASPGKFFDEGNATPVELKATVHQGKKGDTPFTCVAMTHEGLVMKGDRALPAPWMVKLTLHADPDIQFCGTSVFSEGEKVHYVGVKRMGLPPADQAHWTSLVAGDKGQAPGAPQQTQDKPPGAAARPRPDAGAKVKASAARASRQMAGTSLHDAPKKGFFKRLFKKS